MADNHKALEAAQRAQDAALMREPGGEEGKPDGGGGTGGDPGGDRYKSQYGVIVICADEAEQERVYGQLKGQGLSCRVVVT